jgi:hypothetical protein
MTPAEVEKELRLAMKEAQEKGWIIANRVTIDPDVPRCCAIGAYSLMRLNEDFHPMTKTAETFGLPRYTMSSLADGFDGVGYKDYILSERHGVDAEPYHEVGQRLAAEFLR